jgi:hypothetical protein
MLEDVNSVSHALGVWKSSICKGLVGVVHVSVSFVVWSALEVVSPSGAGLRTPVASGVGGIMFGSPEG